MAITVVELIEFLSTAALEPDDLIAVDDGGLTLVSVRNPEIYIEVGGIPLPDDE